MQKHRNDPKYNQLKDFIYTLNIKKMYVLPKYI